MSDERAIHRTGQDKGLLALAALSRITSEAVSVPKVYIDLTDDYEAAAVLDELIFWSSPGQGGRIKLRVRKDGFLWFAIRRGEWWARKRLSARQADRGIARLVEMGLVVKATYHYDGKPTIHLRIIPEAFFRQIGETIQNLSNSDDEDELIRYDEMSQELKDAYEMLGLKSPISPFRNLPNGESPSPFGEAPLPNGESPSPNGESLTSLSSLTSYESSIGAGAPKFSDQPSQPMPLDWQIASGSRNIITPTPDQEWQARRDIALMGICRYGADLEGLALAFMERRRILPGRRDLKGWALALREMARAEVTPGDITRAIDRLADAGMTVADPWGVKKTAIALAHQPRGAHEEYPPVPDLLPAAPVPEWVKAKAQELRNERRRNAAL